MASVLLTKELPLTHMLQRFMDGFHVVGGTLVTDTMANITLTCGPTTVTFDEKKWRAVTGSEVQQGVFSYDRLVELRASLNKQKDK